MSEVRRTLVEQSSHRTNTSSFTAVFCTDTANLGYEYSTRVEECKAVKLAKF